MLNTDLKNLNFEKKNKVLTKAINLDTELDLFILLSSSDTNFCELMLNKIIDLSLDNISKDDSYKDLSNILENLNTTIKTWRQDNKEEELTVLISVLNKNNFMFSCVGSPSAYLVKNTNEVIEITEKEEKNKEFNFISDGKIDYSDSIIMSSYRLLNNLSYSDFLDSSIGKKAAEINKNIETIFEEEKVEKNIGIITLKYNFTPIVNTNNPSKEKLNKILLSMMDNYLVKTIIARYMIIKESLAKQGKIVTNTFYAGLAAICFIGLFFIVDSIVGQTVETKNLETDKQMLTQAKEYIRKASQNTGDLNAFNANTTKAKEIIDDLKEKKVFLNDLEKLNKNLMIIKKQFNGIESFEEKEENLIHINTNKDVVKILEVNSLLYLIGKNNIVGPIIPAKTPNNVIISELKEDEFIDAVDYKDSVILLTKGGKIGEFTKSGNFLYRDVTGQESWEETKTILSYSSNIYLVSKDQKQILKHTKSGNNFNKAVNFLKQEDVDTLGAKILDIAIDGGIYILKDDLTIIKAFSTPYRLESLMINKLPTNYEIEDKSNIKIYARKDLKYVYLLLNNKIWVFDTNVKNFQDTKSLTYLGQIEGGNYKIVDFFVNHDGEIKVLNENGIYKLNFEISDEKLIVN